MRISPRFLFWLDFMAGVNCNSWELTPDRLSGLRLDNFRFMGDRVVTNRDSSFSRS
jgi:hypothetical protein